MIEFRVAGESVYKRYKCAAVLDKAAPGVSVCDIAHLLGRNIQQPRQLFPVTGRLVEHDHKLGVGQHGAGLHRIQQILHVLRDGRGVGVALSELPPCGVKKRTAILVLKDHMELVNENVGALALSPIQRYPVQNGIGNDQQAGGFQLRPQVVNIKYQDTLVQVNRSDVAEHIQGAGGEQLQGQGDLFRFVLRLLQKFLPEGTEGGGIPRLQCLLIHSGGAAVNDGFVLGADTVLVDLLNEGHDKLRFLHAGIVLAIALHHIIALSRSLPPAATRTTEPKSPIASTSGANSPSGSQIRMSSSVFNIRKAINSLAEKDLPEPGTPSRNAD